MPKCPSCASFDVRTSRKQQSKRRQIAWYQSVWRCNQCGHRFIDTDPVLRTRGALLALVVAAFAGVLWNALRNPAVDAPEAAMAASTGSSAEHVASIQGYLSPSELAALRAAAEAGDPAAQYRIATALSKRQEVTGDMLSHGESLRWLQQAASAGYALAESELADRYRDGHGLVQDFVQAAAWYRRAAEQGYAPAMHSLGKMIEAGWIEGSQAEDAYVWFNLAAARGIVSAYKNRNDVMRLLSPQQLNDAQRRSREMDKLLPRLAVGEMGSSTLGSASTKH